MSTNPERAALARLLAIVQHPNAPHYPNLPQTDFASRWYVRLAEAVDAECAALRVMPDVNQEVVTP